MMVALGAVLGLLGSPAMADVGVKDVQVIAKTLGFTNSPLSGSVKVAVVFDAGLDGVVFVTGGLSAQHERIFAAAKARKLLTVSTDPACVRAGRCVMGVKSDPKVEITVNKAAAEASAVGFAPAFRMMNSEI